MATDISVELLWFGVYGRSFENIESLFSLQTLHDKEAASQLPTPPRRFNNFRQEKYIDKARNLGKKNFDSVLCTSECNYCFIDHCMQLSELNEVSVQVYLYTCCLLSRNTLKHPHIFLTVTAGASKHRFGNPLIVCCVRWTMLCYLIMPSYHLLSALIRT